MKLEIGIGLYPLIFIIVFIRRYFAGMDLSDIHAWIGIAITSFFWFLGIVVVAFVGAIVITYLTCK